MINVFMRISSFNGGKHEPPDLSWLVFAIIFCVFAYYIGYKKAKKKFDSRKYSRPRAFHEGDTFKSFFCLSCDPKENCSIMKPVLINNQDKIPEDKKIPELFEGVFEPGEIYSINQSGGKVSYRKMARKIEKNVIKEITNN
ncbi:MAG: hypothetical protein WDK96_01555 [Candidatus Paceibacterota bacterium]|jgi:hypothetical protein